jgi:hypothetical protein
LWIVDECEKPAVRTSPTPTNNARAAALRLSDLCPAAVIDVE